LANWYHLTGRFSLLLRAMALRISNLSKQYGQQWAVDDVSFAVEPGEVVGFLGPNGAGKSTTMKIATGYLPPTKGRIEVDGVNVVENSLAVRKSIGYLPEHNPLYTDMYVHEYLNFCGGIFEMKGKSLSNRVGEIIELCGLEVEQHKKIESLSKGYRQRVGLAQAMLHNPNVLILDEPTTGLDPNQLAEIRSLIKSISQNKTVLFSTHIMQEVQAICDRVVVINKGKIVANDSIHALLQRSTGTTVLLVEFDKSIELELIKQINGVRQVVSESVNSYRIEAEAKTDVRSALFQLATAKNVSLIGLKVEEQSLEAVFKQLTAVSNPSHN
jgi:ABC-2 type transport system ATP-binding protein